MGDTGGVHRGPKPAIPVKPVLLPPSTQHHPKQLQQQQQQQQQTTQQQQQPSEASTKVKQTATAILQRHERRDSFAKDTVDFSGGSGSGGGVQSGRDETPTADAKSWSSTRPQHIQRNKVFQHSSKQLEQILAQRLEKDQSKLSLPLPSSSSSSLSLSLSSSSTSALSHPNNRRSTSETGGNSMTPFTGNGSSSGSGSGNGTGLAASGLLTMTDVRKQIQTKLQEEIKQQCKMIQDKQTIEFRLPQHRQQEQQQKQQQLANQPQTGQGGSAGVGGVGCGGIKSYSSGFISDNGSICTDTTLRDLDIDDLERTSTTLVYRDGVLVSGTLDTLLQHMVPTSDYYPDKSYLFAFLLSARLFIKPHELMARACDLCNMQQKLSDAALSQKKSPHLIRFTANFIQFLTEWLETFPYDFRDERLMQLVRTMSQKCITMNPALSGDVGRMLANLVGRLAAVDKYTEHLEQTNAVCAELAAALDANLSSLPDTDITEACQNTAELAFQLTHIELERLSYIGPEEFVQAFAKENHPNLDGKYGGGGNSNGGVIDSKKTRNLESYVQWFNRLSYLVATEIVKHPKKKHRARVIEYWIEAGRECFNFGNFNSLMAIIAGLNMSPISRLKKTWAKVQSAKFSILEHQMDPTSNFSSYRSTLKAAMWRSSGATDDRQRIVIPFFSLLVKDLYFLNEGCSSRLPNGHINFEKFWQLAKQVNEFIAWKQVSCPFQKNSKVIYYLQRNPVLSEHKLSIASYECEAPDNATEKERYRLLKTEQH